MDMSDEVYRKINFGTPFVYHSLGFLENLTLNRSIMDDIDIMRTDAISFMQRHRENDKYDDPDVPGVDTGGAVWRYYYAFGDHMLLRALFNVPDIDDTTVILQALYENGENINYGIAKMNENREKAIFPGSWAEVKISMYYPSPFTFTFFLSRAYKDGGAPITGNRSININKINEYILADDDKDGQLDRQSTNGSWGNFELINGTKTLVTNDLETALATLSLLNIYDTLNTSHKVIANAAIDNAIEFLLENQNPDGSWDSAFWGLAPLPTRYSGSAEITAGFVLEALAKYHATRPKTTAAVSGL